MLDDAYCNWVSPWYQLDRDLLLQGWVLEKEAPRIRHRTHVRSCTYRRWKMYRRCRPEPVPYACPDQLTAVALRRSCHGLAPARLVVLSVGWCPPPPNESGSP